MRKTILFLISLLAITSMYISCSKGGDTVPPPDPCAGVTILVTGTVTASVSGQSNGSITANATGGTGSFTYSINNGAFQSSGVFNNLAAGSYTITGKNSNGCIGSQQFTVGTAANPCAGVSIIVTSSTTAATPCGGPAGSITVNASGSSGFTYSMNGVNFQAGNSFSNVVAGNYTVSAKDANGCTQTANVVVNATASGPLFSAVRAIIQNNCVSCHNNTIQNGGMNFAVDCNIVTAKERIKFRAVDQAGTGNQMPPPPNPALPAADRQKILDWIAAGGGYVN